MEEEKSSYRSIMKATSLFGGVQVLNILIQIIRSKIVAILLGPVGMGLSSLLNTTIQLMGALTNFGLKTSAVKNVSEANSSAKALRVAIIIKVLNYWIWITGLFGAILTVVFSSVLSKITFGNTDYTVAFVWLSLSLLFNQISSGKLVVLQGLRKIKYLANANLTGAVLGLFVSIPLYYYLGIRGVVPAIISVSFLNMIRSWYFVKKVNIEDIKVTREIVLTEGKSMLVMGFMLSLSGLITLAASYLLRIYISNIGGIGEVGLYGAGFGIINTYFGLVFSAMATDYYPRLSAVQENNKKAISTINQQAEITILIIAPILSFFLIFINWIVIILYSTKFVSITGMLHWAALGIFFKAISWCMAFIFLAKGNGKAFFINELIVNVYLLGFNMIGYKFGGLDGLGISFLVSYILYFFQVFWTIKSKYNFSLKKGLTKVVLIQITLCIACFLIVKKMPGELISYVVGSIFILFSIVYSLFELNNRINIKDLINNK